MAEQRLLCSQASVLSESCVVLRLPGCEDARWAAFTDAGAVMDEFTAGVSGPRCREKTLRTSWTASPTLFVRRGLPAYIRSDNGAEFTANAVRGWLTRLEVRTLYIERGSPWENG